MKLIKLTTLFLILIAQFQTIHAKDIVWTSETSKKLVALEKLWFSHDLAINLISTCKLNAKDPAHCVKLGASIAYNESSAGRNATNNNIFGKRNGKFDTNEDAVEWWVSVYTKKWYKSHKYTPSAFYSKTPIKPITSYCVDEIQKNGKMLNYCPNWHRNSWLAWSKLNF